MQDKRVTGVLAKLAAGSRAVVDLAKRGAVLGRGPNRGNKLPGAPWSQTFPAPGATLDLDFANDRGFVRGVGQGSSMQAVTFTRASNGNWVDSAGVLRTGAGTFPGTANAIGVNLLTFPQDFDNAAWGKAGNGVITANTEIAPDETRTADTFASSATVGFGSEVTQSISYLASTYTISCYVKAGTAGWAYLQIGGVGGNGVRKSFNVASGVSGSTQTFGSGFAFVSSSITSVGNGWYLLTLTATPPSGTNNATIGLTNTDNGGGIASGQFNFIWGAQLELGSSATTYYPTNINVPRFDWASTAVVAQRNDILYTEAFDNSYWPKITGAITTNATTAPNGTSTADLYIPAASSSNSHGIFKSLAPTPTTTTTSSIYLKASGYRYVALLLNDTNNQVKFDLQDGVVGFVGSNIESYTISSAANGFYRISVTSKSPNLHAFFGVYVLPDSSWLNVAGWPTWTANGTSGIYIWGAQRESAAAPTAYIEVGSAVPSNTPLLPASTCNGLLIEESRANRILWCRDATQSNWTKTNVTAAKDQTGIDGVANAASSLTATADNGTLIQPISLASGSRTASVYLKRITGTGNVQVSLDGSTWSTVDLSSTEWRRIVLSGTVTNPVVGIRLATNGDAVAMDYAQVEDGAFATTPILTTTASATRAAEAASISGNAFFGFFNPAQSTVMFKGNLNNAGNTIAWAFEGGTPTFRHGSATATGGAVFIGADAQATYDTAPSAGQFMSAIAVGKNVNISISNGVVNRAYVPSSTTPLSNTTLQVGFRQTTYWNGPIARLAYFPTAQNLSQVTALRQS